MYCQFVDTVSSESGELGGVEAAFAAPETTAASVADRLLSELYRIAEGTEAGLTSAEFASALVRTGRKYHWNLPLEDAVNNAQEEIFYRSLRLVDLALAQGCALGREKAWDRFLAAYRGPLTKAAIAIVGSATVGCELADSLYAELFGMSVREGERRSPLASYSGRGSLMGWLRTTLAQRHVDHHRRTYRETPLETSDHANVAAAPAEAPGVVAGELSRLTGALATILTGLDAEDRFLLSAYFLDRQTLLQIARLLRVHEATVSRRLGRLTGDMRKQLLRNLQAGGLSRRAAEEALGVDPRDLEINIRGLLQTSQPEAFKDRTGGGGKVLSR